MFDNTNFMTKLTEWLLVFAVVYFYFWIVWKVIKLYIYIFKMIFKGLKFLFGRLKNISYI
jgi:hypothetical protein